MTECADLVDRLAIRPSRINVISHAFKLYDEDNRVYCVWCNRVIVMTNAKLESHYNVCMRKPYYQPIRDTKLYECYRCNVSVNNLNEWHSHLITERHEKLAYGNEKPLISMNLQMHTVFHDEKTTAPETEFLELLKTIYDKRVSGIKDALHCCVLCNQLEINKPVHSEGTFCDGGRNGNVLPLHVETFYCPSCMVTFVCDESAYLGHLMSLEHELMFKEFEMQNVWSQFGSNMFIIPYLYRNFKRFSKFEKGLLTCGFCGTRGIRNDDRIIMNHLWQCKPLFVFKAPLPIPPSGKTTQDYCTFTCNHCNLSFTDWRGHFLDLFKTHIHFKSSTYYECSKCRTLFMGTCRFEEKSSCPADNSEPHDLQPFALSDLMRYIFRDINGADKNGLEDVQYFYVQETGKFGRCDRSAEPQTVPYYCSTCRLEFYGNRTMFRQHALTAEHIIFERYHYVPHRQQ